MSGFFGLVSGSSFVKKAGGFLIDLSGYGSGVVNIKLVLLLDLDKLCCRLCYVSLNGGVWGNFIGTVVEYTRPEISPAAR